MVKPKTVKYEDELPLYDLSTLPDVGLFLVLGACGKGKTTWTEFVLQNSPYKDKGIYVAMVGSANVRKHWIKSIAGMYVCLANLDFLEEFIVKQNIQVQTHEHLATFPEYLYLTFVWDDVALNPTFMRNKKVVSFLNAFRQYYARIFVLCQYYKQAARESRGNFQYIFLCGPQSDENLKKIWEDHASFLEWNYLKSAVASYLQHKKYMLIIDKEHCILGQLKMTYEVAEVNGKPTLLFEHVNLGDPNQHKYSQEYEKQLQYEKDCAQHQTQNENEKYDLLSNLDPKNPVVFRVLKETVLEVENRHDPLIDREINNLEKLISESKQL